MTSCGQVHQVRRLTADHLCVGVRIVGDARDRTQQTLRVRVQRIIEKRFRRSRLDDPPGIHHSDLIADRSNHAEVVRHHDDGCVSVPLEAGKDVQNLGLHRNVERRRGLVRNEQRRFAEQGLRDQYALPHPS